MIINLFEISVSPAIKKLFVVDNPSPKELASKKKFVKASQDSIVSLEPSEFSRPLVTGLENYTLWLFREHFFDTIEKSGLFYNVNRWEGSFAILNEKLHREDYVTILREVIIRFHLINNRFYISVLPKTGIYNRILLSKLLSVYHFNKDFFIINSKCLVFIEREGIRGWFSGLVRGIIDSSIKVEIPSLFDGTILVESNRVLPKLKKHDYSFDNTFLQRITKISKEKSSFTSKSLLLVTTDLVTNYISQIFESPFGIYELSLNSTPLALDDFEKRDLSSIDNKTHYIFNRGTHVFTHEQRFIGLSRINLADQPKNQNVVLFATEKTLYILNEMITFLNEGIQSGGYKFDMPSKFGIRLSVVDIYITDDFNGYLEESNKFVFSVEEKHKQALAIAYLPENSDIYYKFKAKLAAHGRVSQIRSKSIFDIYTAWNIAANIYAKIGFTPWTITESQQVENADLILGFSYSSLNVEGKLKRNIGYVNVFDKKGEWKFMRSHPGVLDFNNREKIISSLVQEAIHSFMAGGTDPKIIDIHYSKKFSRRERQKVFDSIIQIIPEIQKVNFVSIDDTHSFRIFDPTSISFNLKRGQMVFLKENEFILSVLGSDSTPTAFRQMKVIINTEGETASEENNIAVAQRILAMTKLNWRSVVKDSSEPVTLKYSSEIAKLTNHFSLTDWNIVSNNLANIPWFI